MNKNCNVVVIGGGTAGLEAACTAAEVGCNTFLLEKGETLGGLASVISKIPAKKRLADFPNYLIHRAEQLENLYIFTNTEGTPENIRKFHPNLIVAPQVPHHCFLRSGDFTTALTKKAARLLLSWE